MFDALLILRAVRDASGAVVDFAYEYGNAAVEDHLGYRPDELVGTALIAAVPHIRDLALFSQLVQVVETGVPMDIEVEQFVSPRTNGSFELRARRLDERVALTIRNVTERRELESLVEESEEHLRQVIDALPVGVSVVNRSGQGIYLNSAGRRIMAVDDPRPGATQEFSELYHLKREFTGEPYPAEELALARVLRTGEPATVDDIVVDRDGDPLPIETHATPLFDREGLLRGAVTVFEDVSQRRAQEALLARALAELTAVNEQLGEFAAMAAHDLASPLRAINGFAELLGDRYGDVLGREAKEWVEFIQADAVRMRTLIDDLLAYARAGVASPPSGQVDLAEVVAEAAEVLGEAFSDRGAELAVETLPEVVGDRAALYVVVRNLAGNALKFLRPDVPGVVRVCAERRGGEWVIAVSDNGVGVPDEERESLFLPFHRGAAAANRGGNGLGLSICRRIMEYHGGRIWYDPTPGGGATFRFTLDAG